MNYITDGQVTYHHAVSPQEVWGDETCAERALGKEIVRSILKIGEYMAYGYTYRPLTTPEELERWQKGVNFQKASPYYKARYNDEGLNSGTVCAYCHGLLTEEPLPDDYPIGEDETPNSPLMALRQQLQRERDAQ